MPDREGKLPRLIQDFPNFEEGRGGQRFGALGHSVDPIADVDCDQAFEDGNRKHCHLERMLGHFRRIIARALLPVNVIIPIRRPVPC